MADEVQHPEGGPTETCQAHNQNQTPWLRNKVTTCRMTSRPAGLEVKKKLEKHHESSFKRDWTTMLMKWKAWPILQINNQRLRDDLA